MQWMAGSRLSLGDKAFREVAFCPGFLRGMAFLGRKAVVGLSMNRANRTFSGLGLDTNLAERDAEPRCALHVIDLDSGITAHWLASRA